MPNYKPKMHMRSVEMTCNWEEYSFAVCHPMSAILTEETTDNWDDVTCGNCRRCRKKGDTNE